MKTNAINWFEIFVADFDRAKAFYEKVLNHPLHSVEMDGIHMALFNEESGDGSVGGAITKMDDHKPGPGGTMVYLNVEGDLDGVLSRVAAAGGKVVRGRTPIPPHGFIGVIEDSEGNVVGLHSMA